MTDADARLAELETLWDERGIRETELQVDREGTIVQDRGSADTLSWAGVMLGRTWSKPPASPSTPPPE